MIAVGMGGLHCCTAAAAQQQDWIGGQVLAALAVHALDEWLGEPSWLPLLHLPPAIDADVSSRLLPLWIIYSDSLGAVPVLQYSAPMHCTPCSPAPQWPPHLAVPVAFVYQVLWYS